MATPEGKMKEFLSTIMQGGPCPWQIMFDNSMITLKYYFVETYYKTEAEVDLDNYPSDVRKGFIQKLRLANIISLPIRRMVVKDETFDKFVRTGEGELPDGHEALTEDIVEIIKAVQSTPTTESNAIGHGHAVCNLMETAGPSTNRTPIEIEICGFLPPQKLKAACSLIAIPGSTVKSVIVDSYSKSKADATLQCLVLEEILSAHKGGSYQALERLEFGDSLTWDDTSIKHLGEFLQCTPSIKDIDISQPFGNKCGDWGTEVLIPQKLAEALCLNNEVHTLRLRNHSPDLQVKIMGLLMSDDIPSALSHLHLQFTLHDTEDCAEGLTCEFIKNVKCLKLLGIYGHIRVPLTIIEALKFNHGLEHIAFQYGDMFHIKNYNHNDDVVFSTIMDVLRVNYQLRDFYYPWMNKYYEEALRMLFEERATNKPWEVMKDMVLVPSTSARWFFCGYPYAGKTTLKNTIVKNLRDKMEGLGPTSEKRKISHNQFTNDVDTYLCNMMDTWDMYNRTRGIEVEAMTLNNLHLTMWDMAGHDAYHPFHDLVISNIDGGGSSCCFLLLCNLFDPQNPTKRKEYLQLANELKYWLQFIASNTKKSIVYHPYVKLIFTGFDKVRSYVETIKMEIERHVKPLQEQFKDILNINEQPFYVNAHDSESIHPLLQELEATLLTLLPTLPRVFEACENLRKFLDEYREMNPTHTLIKWEAFEAICDKVSSLVAGEKIDFEVAKKRREIVATSLHEAGEVIYYKDLDFVILDPHWFCHDVIGQVISCKDCGVLEPQMGMLPSMSLMSFLQESQHHKFDEDTSQDLLRLMIKLDLCIEHVNDTILIPASLCDDENNPSDLGERQLSWLTKKTFHKGVHVGRRVAPMDTNRTMLTLGFFPRLQVSFQRLFEQNGYILKKNMISFIWNEMEIILEYSGHIGFHIDIFIRSQNANRSDVYDVLTNHIIKHIFQECSHPIRGCPRVILEESIIRPSCVKTLVLCKNRMNQVISVQMLKENIKNDTSLSFMHVWKQERGVLAFGYDKALSLLSDPERNDVIGFFSKLITITKQSLTNLPRHERELTSPCQEYDQDMKMGMATMERNLMSTIKSIKKNLMSTLKSTEKNLMSRLESTERVVMDAYERERSETQTLIESKLDDLILLVQGKFHEISLQSRASMSNLSNKFQESLTFGVELERTRCPKFVWFKRCKQQVEAKKKHHIDLRGTKYTVHILCETLIGNHLHEVENQQGIEIKVESESSAKFKKILKYTLVTLSTLIAIGAHVVAPGMGTLIPEIAKGFLLVLDTPRVLNRVVENITPSVSNPCETILQANKEAKRFVEDLLRNQDIEDVFGLYKVKYKNCEDDVNGRIAWICKKCKDVEDNEEKIDFLGCTLHG